MKDMSSIFIVFVAIVLSIGVINRIGENNSNNLSYGENILNKNISSIEMKWNITWSVRPSGGIIFTKGSEYDVDVGLRGEPYKYSLMIKQGSNVVAWKQVVPREWSAVPIEDYATLKIDFITDTITYSDKAGESMISYSFPEGNVTRISIRTIGDTPLKYAKYG